MRTVFSFALGAATGAAAARLLTPGNGRKAASAAASVASAASTQAHHSTNTMKGVAHAVTPHRHEPMDDMTLADRVRSEIFRDTEAPKGGVSVDVQAGVAYLRGEVPDAAWAERFGKSARKVTGIDGVKNLLHTPGTPTPTAEPRSVASEQFGDH
jgi:osmotically-inducible protein OsmY